MPDTADRRQSEVGDDARRRRLIANERRVRRMNSRIEELNRVAQLVEDEEDAEQAQFLCECSHAACAERLDLDVDEYARLHDGPDRFVLVPGHEMPSVDRVLVRREDCLVVCKP